MIPRLPMAKGGSDGLSNALRVMLVGRNPLARIGLAAMLNTQEALTVVAEVGDPTTLAEEIALHVPHVLVWDVDNERALEALAGLGTAPPILALLAEAEDVEAAWMAGVRGLLPRQANAAALKAAIQAIHNGLVVISPALMGVFLPNRQNAPSEALTGRESEVLRLIAEGLPNKAIALKLGISENTVKFHVNAILGKLGVQSRTEAVVQAVRQGLLML
jgi:two-component system, NarL family, nitrate/nitrite response regulator NarL